MIRWWMANSPKLKAKLAMAAQGSNRKRWWNGAMYVGFALCILLAIISLPSSSIPYSEHFVPQTKATFSFIATDPYFKNATILEGVLTLTGIGGLSVDNPLTLSVTVDIVPNASKIVDPLQMGFLPELAYNCPSGTSCPEDGPDGFPLLSVIPLTNQSLSWSGSQRIEYFNSGTFYAQIRAFNDSYPNGKNNTPLELVFGTAPIIEISPEDVTVSAINDAYTTALTFTVVALAILALRVDPKK
jgi:hypothetical protein